MLAFLEDVVVDDADVESLESFPRSESQGVLDGNLIGSGVGRFVFRPVTVWLKSPPSRRKEAANSSDVLHHRVVARIEEDADLAVVEKKLGRVNLQKAHIHSPSAVYVWSQVINCSRSAQQQQQQQLLFTNWAILVAAAFIMIFLFHMHMAIVSAAASTILRSSQISIYGSLGLAGLLILIFGRLKDMENRL